MPEGFINNALIILGIIIISILSNLIAKRYILTGIQSLISKSQSKLDDFLVERKVFLTLSHLVPALVLYCSANFMFPNIEFLRLLTMRVSLGYMILIGSIVFSKLLDSVSDIYNTFEISKERPIKSYIQILKLIIFLFCAILIIATLMDKSPWAFFSGIGAMTAIILLVFKDTILGLVASIQLGTNNLVKIDDWIVMSKYGADGNVIDISLNSVRIQNFDKTITSIPTYALMSESFKNWRGMSESGGRRIKRSLYIDMQSVKFCSNEMMEKYKEYESIEKHIEKRIQEHKMYFEETKSKNRKSSKDLRFTTLGAFRAYVKAYLDNHPKINKDMTVLVRLLAPTEKGIPLEIYAFSKETTLVDYERIQSEIIEHTMAIASEFDLRIFQNPSGFDFQKFNS